MLHTRRECQLGRRPELPERVSYFYEKNNPRLSLSILQNPKLPNLYLYRPSDTVEAYLAIPIQQTLRRKLSPQSISLRMIGGIGLCWRGHADLMGLLLQERYP